MNKPIEERYKRSRQKNKVTIFYKSLITLWAHVSNWSERKPKWACIKKIDNRHHTIVGQKEIYPVGQNKGIYKLAYKILSLISSYMYMWLVDQCRLYAERIDPTCNIFTDNLQIQKSQVFGLFHISFTICCIVSRNKKKISWNDFCDVDYSRGGISDKAEGKTWRESPNGGWEGLWLLWCESQGIRSGWPSINFS